MSRSKKDGKHGGGILLSVTSMISTCVKNATIGKSVNIIEVKK